MAVFTIGRAAEKSGVHLETIRYYERIGLVEPPSRTEGGQRRYTEDDLNRLAFVKRCRELGFSLEQIRALLELVDGGDYSCGEVKQKSLDHLVIIRKRIEDLMVMADTLEDMAARCDGGEVPDCPIIDSLFANRPPAG